MALLEAKPAVISAATVCADLNTTFANGETADFPVCGFSTDTRTITQGSCFLALKGENFNGNAYAKQAAEKGASMCILSEAPAEDPGVPYLLCDDTVRAYGILARAQLKRLKAQGVRVVAITGSSGKTTVKDMTAHVLSAHFRTYCTAGNHNNHIGLPYTILRMPEDTQVAVLEMGMNHAGEIRYLTGIGQPDIGIVTNIGTAHIGNLGSQMNIFHAKMELTEGMSPETGRLILPADDTFLANREAVPFPEAQLRYITRTGMDGAVLTAVNIAESPESTRFTVRYGTETADVLLPMTGLHNVTNACLAIEAGLECGMTLSECAAALRDFVPGAMRSERVVIGNCTVIRDYYNANPEAMAASLQAMEIIADGARKIAVLGNMNELGEFAPARHEALGRLCKNAVDCAFFCGVNHGDFARGYGEGAKAFAGQQDMIDAMLAEMPALLQEKCCVLIKGSRGLHMENAADALEKLLREQHD